mmetsp:Transcript_19508/g.28916  ORF Transcript_19508/g.28916 Transcript_19508/m.28916 type:complete len:158 (+) Transcript_19508:60-533(+)
MAPWQQIVKPFSLYFALNCIKTVCGAGLVGYGVALAVTVSDHDDDDDDGHQKHDDKTNKNLRRRIRKCVTVATTIGFGAFLSLPALTSQIFWETMIPVITATDIAYDISTENIKGIFPKIPKMKIEDAREILDGLMRRTSISERSTASIVGDARRES